MVADTKVVDAAPTEYELEQQRRARVIAEQEEEGYGAARLGYDWFMAERLLNGRNQRKIGNNTWAIREESGDISIKLHFTKILTFHQATNTCTYNTGGWQSVTTKRRIGEYAPIPVYQKNHVWYFWGGAEYYDGDVIQCRRTQTIY